MGASTATEMKRPGARGLTPGEVLDGLGAAPAYVDRASGALFESVPN